MTATDLKALDLALGEWVAALVACAAPGRDGQQDDEVQVIPASCVAPAWQQGDDRVYPPSACRLTPKVPAHVWPRNACRSGFRGKTA